MQVELLALQDKLEATLFLVLAASVPAASRAVSVQPLTLHLEIYSDP